MVMLVSVGQAKLRLKIDNDASDSDLTLMIQGASAACLNYLKLPLTNYAENSTGEMELDSNANPVGVPAEVQNAVLLLVGIWYRDPDASEMEKWQLGYLPMPVIALLYPLRDPSMA